MPRRTRRLVGSVPVAASLAKLAPPTDAGLYPLVAHGGGYYGRFAVMLWASGRLGLVAWARGSIDE